MNKIKRITALTLAMFVFASFCITRIMATPQSVFYEYVGPIDTYYFFDLSTGNYSYARTGGNVFGWNEEVYTDFEAETYAQNVFFEGWYYLIAEVSVGVYYDDEGFSVNHSDREILSHSVSGVNAFIYGMDIIDSEHGIEYFSADHELLVGVFQDGEADIVVVDRLAPTIIIGTSY